MNHGVVKPWLAGVTLLHSLAAMALEDIPVAYWIVAKSYEMPVDILYAIALAESGKRYQKTTTPWPWALNIDGQSVFCDSQREAVSQIGRAVANKKPVDIGLMQVSWRWHSQRFSSVEEALIPMRNLSAGAAILHEQFEQTKDWWIAVGRYHDPGQDAVSLENAQRYRERIRQHWQGLM